MAYNAIPTITTGDVATASWGNTYLKDNFAAGVPDIFTADGEVAIGTGANAAEAVAILDSSNRLTHEYGGMEFDASGVTTGDTVVGQSSGVIGLETAMTQGQAEAGSDTQVRGVTAERIAQAIAALAAGSDISARIYNDAAQSTANATLTTLVFDQERYDTDGLHDPGSNPGRLTVPAGQGGKYIVTGNVAWASNATGSRVVRIYKEGSDIVAENVNLGGTAGVLYMTVTTQIDLAATDYVELRVEQNSGGSLNVNASTSSDMREADFMMAKVLG